MIKQTGKLILLALMFHTATVSYAQDNVIDEVIWVVGNEPIYKSDVERARLEMQASGAKFDGDPYCFIPEQLAIQKIYLDQAKIDSITINETGINREVAEHEKASIAHTGSKEKVEEYLGASMPDLRDKWREMIRNQQIVEETRRSIISKTKSLTPSEVRKYYSGLAKDSLPFIPLNVEVQIITYEPEIPLAISDEIKERLRGFTDRINKGEASFASLAIMYSEDGSAPNGGELDFSTRSMFVPEFSNVAFSLNDPNKISNIVETEFGFHIIQLVERRGDRAKFKHILLRPQVPKKEMDIAFQRVDSLANEIKNNVFTFEEAALLSADKDTRKNGGLMVNYGRGDFGEPRFALEELPPEIAMTVDTMQVGQISSAFNMKNKSGNDIVAIVKLRDKIDGHIANVSDDFQVLKSIVEQRKRSEVLENWITKKINDTYIKIHGDWAKCDFKYKEWIKPEEETKKTALNTVMEINSK